MYLTLPIHRMLREDPERTAIVFGERRTTRGRFAERVGRLAAALQASGVSAGDRVGILALNSDRYLESYFGVWWAGAAVNPVNIRWSPAEIAYSLDDCDTRTLLIDETFAPMAAELRSRSKALRTLVYCGDGPCPEGMLAYEAMLAARPPVADAMRAGEELAAVMYTGGTTGRPKGVMLSHRALVTSQLGSLGTVPRRGAHAIGLHAAPMFHVAGIAIAIQLAMRLGTQVAIPSFTPAAALAAIARERVTEMFLVPTMLGFMLDDPALATSDLSSLDVLLYGAAPMDSALLDRALAALPGVEFVHVYGMTELCGAVTALPAFFHTKDGQSRGKLRSAGTGLISAELQIVDPNGTPVPPGTVGEVIARRPMLMSGYWNRPAETAAALRDGWMFTGDGGRMDDEGFVTIVDRIKDMIITGGENVYSAEVESAISTLEGVAMCGVVGIPDEVWGERVHAVVVRRPGAAIDAGAGIAHCRTLIAGYKCPRSVEFREALPLSPVGKLLKYQLRAEVRDRMEATAAT